MDTRVIVVGAGAAGIIAACRAASLGANTILLEKTSRLGTKILISGGGKCNITHAGPIKEVLHAYRHNEAAFIRPACYRFTNEQVVEMLTSRGLNVYTRPNGRIFPVDKTAKEVVGIFGDYLREAGVRIEMETAVTGLLTQGNRVIGVKCGDREFRAEATILACGGSSYPGTGTTGDGWPWAKELGHIVVKVRAALAPIHVIGGEDWPTYSGISLRECVLKARQNDKEIVRWPGDMLFTHHGISGPTALGISRVVAEHSGLGPISLEVDLLPDQTFEQLTEKVRDWAAENPRKLWSTFVGEIMPERLAAWFLSCAGVDSTQPAGATDKKAKNRLVSTLKGWPVGQVRDVPIEKGEVVAGGIALD